MKERNGWNDNTDSEIRISGINTEFNDEED